MSAAADPYGVVGHPVGHSLSPFIHGLFARETGQAMSYHLYDVTTDEFAGFVSGFFDRGGRGLNITVPHKVAAVDAASELTARAAHAAAVNTLALRDDGTILGDNTDGVGLVRDLCDNLGLVITNRRILIIGAGGATRGVLAPLLGLSPTLVVIANRTPERAAVLAAAFADLGAVHGVGFEDVGSEPFDIIINATSASLSGEMPPVPAGAVGRATVCYDLAYGRGATAFVDWARAHGAARALQGWGMLVEQAAEAFRLWRGIRPATATVLAALKERSARS
jgi:shikimate dehydrogenase